MRLASPSRRPVPNELLYTIILRVIANSVHAICFCPGDVKWEMNALPTLCKVSYNFRAITLELTRRAFQITKVDADISSIFPPIAKQLQRLRSFGLRLYQPPIHSSHFQPLPEDSVLLYGYSLFLAARELRYHAASTGIQIYQTTQEIIISALSMSLVICKRVEPPGMADVLSEVMHKEMDLVRSELDIVQATMSLGRLLELGASLDGAKADDVDEKRLEIRTRIPREIDKIEAADRIYVEIIESDKIFRSAELPGVVPTVRRLRKVYFEDDEHEIVTSAEEREIREKFEPFGEIQAIKIAYRPDGTARGFAHVEFVHEADAAGALASASEEPVYLLDRDLRVDFAARRDRPSDSGEPTHSLYFHGLRGGESVLRDAIRPFRSSIVNTHFLKNRETGEETGAGFIQFMSTERATEALRELNGLQLEDNETLFLRYAYPKRTRADEPYDGNVVTRLAVVVNYFPAMCDS
ncbi:hypothetical protein LshimejAT787_1601810 [Lyophyllum shimeji]|uniref:RRM domain-containing protein n=1 Tax=Lyophyllum shimeji TaxID=47721 RepID=A0A9P3Q015_LYOSH|nr:hypothetical protein LshimejAT787_1601810 [Lyophyllum shimeji]